MQFTINVAPGAMNTTINVTSNGSASMPPSRIRIVNVENCPTNPSGSRSSGPVRSMSAPSGCEFLKQADLRLRGMEARINDESIRQGGVAVFKEPALAKDVRMLRFALLQAMRDVQGNNPPGCEIVLRQLEACRVSFGSAAESFGAALALELGMIADDLKKGMAKFDAASPAV
ncbi:MAG TPA: hypothetical protein VGO76_19540 [Luteibacter sp.]|jgi:hypothetical protein|nr:hypothetical protein [Luteibacter sp.]